MNVSTILDDIDRGKLALPLFQRGYVWTGKDVKKLMRSLYLGYPVGGLLLWGTTADFCVIRSSGPTLDSGAIELLLDGQQRMTTLYGIIRGAPPTFFEGDPKAFTGLFGNCAFQTRNTNQAIRDRAPKDYMPEITENRPGALESQWVPNCPELWKVENYQEFLAERRRLLAEAANEILEFLRTGNLPSAKGGAMLGSSENDEEAAILDEFNRFVVNAGLAEGSTGYEIVDENNGALIALLDLAWPNGLQDGFSERVAVLINEGASARIAANNAGFSSIFTNLEEFQHYVRREILGEDAEGA